MPKQISLLAALAAATCMPAIAQEAPKASLTLERHHTTNALDASEALGDWYTSMRGTAGTEAEIGAFTLGLKGEIDVRRYDHYRIEDDIKGSVTAVARTTLGEQMELRGTVAWRGGSEGDDIAIEDFRLGTRTLTNRISANLEAGIRIGDRRTLLIELASSYEHNGKTAFEDDLIDPVKLEPDRLRHRLNAALIQQAEDWKFGLRGFAGAAITERLGEPPIAASFAEMGLRGEASGSLGGITVAGSLGLELLADLDGGRPHILPVSKITFDIPIGKWARLSPELESRIETDDTDDALGSWVRRAQMEIAVPLGESVSFGAGAFVQSVDNLTLDYDERGFGAYGEIAWKATARSKLVLRTEYSEEVYIQVQDAKRTLDTFIGFRAEL